MVQSVLCVLETGIAGNLPQRIEVLGYEVVTETSSRRAMSRLKTWQPDVLVADFYKRYFHDRVSNLESLLALANRHPATRIVVIYEPFHVADVELLKQRHVIHAALPLPLVDSTLQSALSGST